MTGTQINLKKLGKVPSAQNADHASSAGFATHATNANTVDGEGAGAFEPASNWVRSGLVTADAGQAVPLASFGALALKVNCVSKGGGNVAAEIDATSTVANSDGYGATMTTARSLYDVLSIGTNSSFEEANDQATNFFTPTGQTYLADLTLGENYLGATCYANALVSPS